jgi:ribosomal protein RSM22 (predicted rRNA methylase)
MKLKKSKSNMEDVKYSYVLLKKPGVEGEVREGRRIVAPPLKRQGHVVIDTCAGSGKLERITIAKSVGEVYTSARKSFWGDVWTGGSGNAKVVIRETLTDIKEEEIQEEEVERKPFARKRADEIDFSNI